MKPIDYQSNQERCLKLRDARGKEVGYLVAAATKWHLVFLTVPETQRRARGTRAMPESTLAMRSMTLGDLRLRWSLSRTNRAPQRTAGSQIINECVVVVVAPSRATPVRAI
mmetsp:Transcript_30463/g.94091  ORF Transcript_30463/g.94091 Transcript_30463/m.94091 type:complete len:111 (-) Transcript_30463:102-434(-)